MTTVSTNELTALKQTLKQYRARLDRLEVEQEKFLQRIDKLAGAGEKEAGRRSRPPQNNSAHQLILAIQSCSPSTLRRLLRDGVSPNVRDKDSTPAIVVAASSQQPLQAIRALLRAGADVDSTDNEGNTALIVSVRDEDIESVKQLIRHGANVNAKNHEGDTPLTNAATWGAAKVVRFLLSNSADSELKDGIGLTALELARQHGHTHVVNLLS